MSVQSLLQTPGALERSGVLEVGVVFGGAVQKDFTVGPLTVDAQGRAEATMPDWIDLDLIARSYAHELAPERQREFGLEMAKFAPLTPGEKHRVDAMLNARYNHLVKFRVMKFGGIPQPMIPEALEKLLTEDLAIIVTQAQEVDVAEETFRRENKTSVAGGPDTGPGGDHLGFGDGNDL